MNGESPSDINLPPKIPAELISAGYRFIRILPRSKDPIDRDYPNTKNYSADDPVLTSWITHYQSFELKSREEEGYYNHFEGYGNYGVLCSETLIALDLDREDIIKKALTHPILKNALSAQSGSGSGLHIWIKTSGGRTTKFSDPETKENVGHIKAKGGYVVGPGSIHPSGGLYHIVTLGRIPTIPFHELIEFFSDYSEKQKPVVEDEARAYSDQDDIEIPIEEILMPTKAIRVGREIQGGHPIHGSKGGKNLSINTQKNTWFCHRCGSGGGAAHAIAVAHGLIDCSDAHRGCFKGNSDLYQQVLGIAEEVYGWIPGPRVQPVDPFTRKLDAEGASSDLDFDFEPVAPPLPPNELNYLPPVEVFQNTKFAIVKGSPRYGKSHHMITVVAGMGKEANVIAPTHAICEQHVRVFRTLHSHMTAIHLEGKSLLCNTGRMNCKHCELYPFADESGESTFLQFKDDVLKELNDKRFLDRTSIPEGYCKYHFLKMADKYADINFTVSANLNLIKERHLLMIDEDPSISHFYPESIKIAEYYRSKGEHHINISELEQLVNYLVKWERYYEEHPRSEGKGVILQMIHVIRQVHDRLKMLSDSGGFNSNSVIEELSKLDTKINATPEELKKAMNKIGEFQKGFDFLQWATALAYQFQPKRFFWTGNKHRDLHLIADEERIICTQKYQQLFIIGMTRAELLLKQLAGNDYLKINLDKFPFASSFTVLKIKKEKKVSYRASAEHFLKSNFDAESEVRYPWFVPVSTKNEAARLSSRLGEICHVATTGRKIAQVWNYAAGFIVPVTTNSVISRGVDVEEHKRSLIYSATFAIPYWMAVIESSLENNDREKAGEAQWIINEIISDEATNLFLRISPIRSDPDDARIPRFVIVGEDDIKKIRPYVLDGMRVIDTTFSNIQEGIGNVLDVTGCRKLDLATKNITSSVEYHGPLTMEETFSRFASADGKPKDRHGRPLDDKYSTPHARAVIESLGPIIAQAFINKDPDCKKGIRRKNLTKEITAIGDARRKNRYPEYLVVRTITNMISDQIIRSEGHGSEAILYLREYFKEKCSNQNSGRFETMESKTGSF